VTTPSSPQNYGSLCTGDPIVFRNFTFTVNPALPCGSTVTASLAAVDGATNFGTLTYTFVTGSTVTTNVQNFDSVVAPALPAGWTTTFSGTGTAVTTSTAFPDAAPNDIFLSEATNVGLSEVQSAPIPITTAGQQLSFRNLFNTESGFDGLVLEIKIGAGAFQDILAAGGTFASGGYNSTLATGFSNPLPGRMGWTGLSGGTAAAPAYITTLVNLPAAAVGQTVQFQWRQGSDNSVAPTNPGSRIDTITLSSNVCGGSAPVPTSALSRKAHGAAGTFDIPLPFVALTGAIGIEDRTGPVSGAHQIVVTFPSAVTAGGVAVTTGTGAAAFTVAGAVVTINLTGVTDVQRLGVTLSNVSDGTNLGSVLVPIGIVLGDTNGNGQVTATDVSQTKANAAVGTVTAATFRTDVNVSGTIDASDMSMVKGRAGAVLP
jgi:Dockerin type I domain